MKTFRWINVLIIILIALSTHTFAQADKFTELRQKLSQLEAAIVGAEDVLEGSKQAYEDAIGTDKEEGAKARYDNAYSDYQSLVNAHTRIRGEIDALNKIDVNDNLQTITTNSDALYINKKLNLLPGWNTLSLPVNQTLSTSNAIFKNSTGEKNYSVIWGYDKGEWIKNPSELKPVKGYYIYITAQTGIEMNFGGAGFSTDLDSPVKEANKWYFLGVSNPISSVDYSRFIILSFKGRGYYKNPETIGTAEAFWVYKIK
mgnify:CR=1 FL=1